jgi:hypothetical protein
MRPADQAPRAFAVRRPSRPGGHGAVLLPGAAALPRAAGLAQIGAWAHAAARALACVRPGKQALSIVPTMRLWEQMACMRTGVPLHCQSERQASCESVYKLPLLCELLSACDRAGKHLPNRPISPPQAAAASMVPWRHCSGPFLSTAISNAKLHLLYAL